MQTQYYDASARDQFQQARSGQSAAPAPAPAPAPDPTPAVQAGIQSQSAPAIGDEVRIAHEAAAPPPAVKKPGRKVVKVDVAEVQSIMSNDCSRYKLHEQLGKGAYGTVKRATDTQTGEEVAVKIVAKELLAREKDGEKRLYREVAIMGRLRHPNLVNLHQLCHNAAEDQLWIVVEIVIGKGAGGKGELMHLIDTADNHRLSEDVARNYFQQLVYGINYVHSQKIAHRDLKPENILVTKDEQVKITDFGLSNVQNTDTMGAVVGDMNLKTCCGTPYYVAPEVVSKRGGYSGFTADVWSMGVILFVMLTGNLPFTARDLKKLLSKIKEGRFDIPSPLEGGGELSADARDCLRAILTADAEKRPKLYQIANLAWVRPGFSPDLMDTEQYEVDERAVQSIQDIVSGWGKAKDDALAPRTQTIGAAPLRGGQDARAQFDQYRRQQGPK